jgi:hypothetical protein
MLDNVLQMCKFRLVPYKNMTLLYRTILITWNLVWYLVPPNLNRYHRYLKNFFFKLQPTPCVFFTAGSKYGTHLSWEKTYVFPLDVFAEGHL